MPLAGEDMTTATAVVPVAKQLLRLEGVPDAEQFVRHLRFEGLKFYYSEFAVKPTGHSDGQAAFSVPAATSAM